MGPSARHLYSLILRPDREDMLLLLDLDHREKTYSASYLGNNARETRGQEILTLQVRYSRYNVSNKATLK